MRYLGIVLILSLSACSVANNTARHSGVGFTNTNTSSATAASPAGEADYRAKLFEDMNG